MKKNPKCFKSCTLVCTFALIVIAFQLRIGGVEAYSLSNGCKWQVVHSPTPGAQSQLGGVAAISPNDVWAVGSYNGGAVAEHWNGIQWRIGPTPHLSHFDFLSGVSAISTSDI